MVAGSATPAGATAVQAGCPAVAHHVVASHAGASCTTLSPTATQRWSVTLNGQASYPIIAAGKVFVTTPNSSSYGGWLYAFDASTGAKAWGPVPLAGTYFYFPLAFDGGRLFVNNFDGTVVAFNPSSGRQLWAQPTSYFSGEPVARAGVVYVHGSSSVYALSEKDGHVLWTSPYLDGDGSSLSVDASGVYVVGGCSRFGLSLAGAVLWSGNDGCSGGGSGTTYLAGDRVFATVGNHILRKSDGAVLGSFTGSPAFSGTKGYFANGTSLFAENISTLSPIFTVDVPSTIVAGPVIANGAVYVGTADSKVYALSTTDGSVLSVKDLPQAPGGGGQYFAPPSDIAVGQGLLVVPGGNVVTAFG